MPTLPGMNSDVYFGDNGEKLPDWRKEKKLEKDDDEEEMSPEEKKELVAILGFDPDEEDTSGGSPGTSSFPVEENLKVQTMESGFTGTIKDSMGREYHYQDGKRVSSPGGSEEPQHKHGERAAGANELFRQAKETRLNAFNSLKFDAQNAQAKHDESVAQLADSSSKVSSRVGEDELGSTYEDLDALIIGYEDNNTIQDRLTSLKEIRIVAKQCLEINGKIKPGETEESSDTTSEEDGQKHDWFLIYKIGEKQSQEPIEVNAKTKDEALKKAQKKVPDAIIQGSPFRFADPPEPYTAKELSENERHLKMVIAKAKEAYHYLLDWVHKRREMKAIKTGEDIPAGMGQVGP